MDNWDELYSEKDLYDYDNINDDEFFTQQIINKNYDSQLRGIFKNLDNNNVMVGDKHESLPIDETKERLLLDSDVIHTFTGVIEKDQDLKSKYAKWLIIIFVIQLVAYNLIFILVGLHVLKFSEVTLDLYIGGGILEVIATIKIIVSYLFKDNITESLKNILEKNKSNK